MKCRFYYCSDCLLCCRADGSDLYLISSNFLHIFDQTMSMLPFATRTDMIEAFKRADAKISEVYRRSIPSWTLYLPRMMRQERGLS